MYSYTFKDRKHQHEELPAVRKSAYEKLTEYNQRIYIEKDGEPYGMMVMLDDGVWMEVYGEKFFKKVRPAGTVAS